MSQLSFDQQSVNDTIRRIREFTKEMDDVINNQLKLAAKKGESLIKQRLTDNGQVITGRLRSSIHSETTNSDNYQYSDQAGGSFDGSLNTEILENEIALGTNVNYAESVEFHSKKGNYFYPSTDQMYSDLQDRLKRIDKKVTEI
jgi:hypothetical protein